VQAFVVVITQPCFGQRLSFGQRCKEFSVEVDAPQRDQPLFWHLQISRPIAAMRDGDYSLVANPDYELSTGNMFQEAWIPIIKSGGYKDFQLYNLRKDPGQTTDIAAEYPEITARLKKKFLAISASIMADGEDWHLTGGE
jgi:arylsulfatase A